MDGPLKWFTYVSFVRYFVTELKCNKCSIPHLLDGGQGREEHAMGNICRKENLKYNG